MSAERRDEVVLGLAKAHTAFLDIQKSEEWESSLQIVVSWAEEEFMTSIHVHGESHICFMDFSRESEGMEFIKCFFKGYVRVVKNHALFPECMKNLLGYPVREEVEVVELSGIETDRKYIEDETIETIIPSDIYGMKVKEEEQGVGLLENESDREYIEKEVKVMEKEMERQIEALDAELTMLKKLLRLEVGEKRFTKVLKALEILK